MVDRCPLVSIDKAVLAIVHGLYQSQRIRVAPMASIVNRTPTNWLHGPVTRRFFDELLELRINLNGNRIPGTGIGVFGRYWREQEGVQDRRIE